MIISNFPAAGGSKPRIYTGTTEPSDTGGIWINSSISFNEITLANQLPASPTTNDLCILHSSKLAYNRYPITKQTPMVYYQPVMAAYWDGTKWTPVEVWGYDESESEWVLLSNNNVYFFRQGTSINYVNMYDINGTLLKTFTLTTTISGSSQAMAIACDPSTKEIFVGRQYYSSYRYVGVECINYETGASAWNVAPASLSSNSGSDTNLSLAVNETGILIHTGIKSRYIDRSTRAGTTIIPNYSISSSYYMVGPAAASVNGLYCLNCHYDDETDPEVTQYRYQSVYISGGSQQWATIDSSSTSTGYRNIAHCIAVKQDSNLAMVLERSYYTVLNAGVNVKGKSSRSSGGNTPASGIGIWTKDDLVIYPTATGVSIYSVNVGSSYALTHVANISFDSALIAGFSPLYMDAVGNVYCIAPTAVYQLDLDDYSAAAITSNANVLCNNMGDYNTAPEQYLF
jgi:hypothetical protein